MTFRQERTPLDPSARVAEAQIPETRVLKTQAPATRAPKTPAGTRDPQAEWSPGKGTAALFVLATLACVAALAATYFFFVRTTTGQFIDESALVEAVELSGTAGKAATKLLDWLPALSVVIASIVVVFVTIVRRRWSAAGIAIAACLGANVATQILKDLLPVRPYRGIETLELNSLPSGHTTMAASAAAAVFLMVSPRWRPLAGYPGRQLRRRHRGVHADQPVAPSGRRRRGVPRGGGLYAPGGLADHPQGPELERLGRLQRTLGVSQVVGGAPGSRRPCRGRGGRLFPADHRPRAGQEISTTSYFWAGTSLIVIAGYLATVAGVWLFGRCGTTPPRCGPGSGRQ